MNIAILSGKGGTGKTTISTNLALALQANYVDVDVEEPNGFLFLKPKVYEREEVMLEYPIIDKSQCTFCGKCVRVCQFNALAQILEDIMLFDKLCHGCGACKIACQDGAISYGRREIGRIERGYRGSMECSRGILNISEPVAVPIIRQLLKQLPDKLNLIDCPPGTSCNVVNSLRYVQGAILVTEPTQFGLHDLRRAVKLVKMFDIPLRVIINKDDGKDNIAKEFCTREDLEIIGTIPYSKSIAQAYSKGELLYDDVEYRSAFESLAERAREVLSWS